MVQSCMGQNGERWNFDFMIPFILYIDKTQISVSGKLSIYPVQMSLGIFTEMASVIFGSFVLIITIWY
jgi:hypothetical protein